MNHPADKPTSEAKVDSDVIQAICRLAIQESLLSEVEVHSLLAACHQTGKEVSPSIFVKEALAQGKLTLFQAKLLLAQPAQALSLGPYLLIDKIGQGGMGSVYKARHKTMGRLVAIKVLSRKGRLSNDSVRRFRREVQAAAKLLHPNIVTAFDAGEQNSIHYLVMEYVAGQDLKSYVEKNGPLPIPLAINYLLQAARGFQFAHENQIIHRDIKPANLLLDKDGTVKILDMGLARFVQQQSDDALSVQELTADGAMMGTIDYLSPEQGLDTKNADARSDIYSLGCTLHYLVTAQTVFPAGTLVQKILAHREMVVPSLTTLRPEVPAALDDLFRRMLAKESNERPQTMAEVVATLQTIADGQLSPAPLKSMNPEEIHDDNFLESLIAGQQPIKSDSHGIAASFSETVSSYSDVTCDPIATPRPSTSVSSGATLLSNSQPSKSKGSSSRKQKVYLWQVFAASVAVLGIVGLALWSMLAPAADSRSLSENHKKESRSESTLMPPVEGKELAERNSTTSESSGSLTMTSATLALKIAPVNATVSILDTDGKVISEFLATTEEHLTRLPKGDYRLIVQSPGYASIQEDVQLRAEKTLVRELLLNKLESPTSEPSVNSDVAASGQPDVPIEQDSTMNKVAENIAPALEKVMDAADKEPLPLESPPKGKVLAPVDTPQWEGWATDKKAPKPMLIPCSPKEAAEYQRQWARYYKKKVFINFNNFMNFVFIPPGEFEIGIDDTEIQELVQLSNGMVDPREFEASKPKHRVVIPEPFYISVDEVTTAQLFAMFGLTSYRSTTNSPPDAKQSVLPATVTYAMAIEFCNKMCQLNKNPPTYLLNGASVQSYGNKGFRLPTDAEWEFMARAGSSGRFWCKLEELHRYDIFRENSAMPNMTVLANPFGVRNVYGNFGEYIEGSRGDQFNYQPSPAGLTIMERSKRDVTHSILRGATSSLSYLTYHVAKRGSGGEDPGSIWVGDDKGFRVVMDIEMVK